MMNDEWNARAAANGRETPDDAPQFDGLQLFYGETSPAEARVYARLPAVDDGSRYMLSGSVSGPFCQYSRTLPAVTELLPRGTEPALLAEAMVADPCFWSPELPMLYRVHVELSEAGKAVAAADRQLGIRPLAAIGRRLIHGGKNLVLRGAQQREHADSVAAWHAAEAALWLPEPKAELLAEASRLGAWLVVDATPATLGDVACCPAVAVCILPCDAELTDEQRDGTRNLVLASLFEPNHPVLPPAWCEAAVVRAMNAVDLARYAAESSIPVIACRPDAAVEQACDVRRGCDRLQRDLAGRGEFAGYFV